MAVLDEKAIFLNSLQLLITLVVFFSACVHT